MTTAPEWTYRHADQLRSHWWWRPGWQVGTRFYAWHITVADQPGLHQLASRYQTELATVDGLDLIPRDWLHLTMQGVGFVDEVTHEQLSDILSSARVRLARVKPVLLRFHRPVIRPEAIALPPAPVEPVQQLRTVVREAIADVVGPDAVPDTADGFQPHISLAYVSTEQPADNTRHAIERIDAEPVDLVVTAVSLIEMHRDRRMYEWQTVEAVPLGQPA
jgi:2'-5' RNA ligase